MTTAGLLAFLGVSLLLIVTPGQDMALVLRNTLAGGRRAGILTGCGVVVGLVIWAVVAALGLATLMRSSQLLFDTLKIAGALYLAYLGLQALRNLSTSDAQASSGASSRLPALGGRVALRQGLISNLGNPKIAVFFSSLLPQFLETGDAGSLPVLALGSIFCLITLAWLVAYASALDRAGGLMRHPAVRKVIEGVTGVVLIGLALRLVTERR